MSENLIVKDSILIHAEPAKVWEILIKPVYVAQWDELPEDYPSSDMKEGSKVVWDLPDGEQSITKIIKAEEMKELKISLLVTKWKNRPREGNVGYVYRLEEQEGNTLLSIEIGDFSLVENGRMYYDASMEFADESKRVIKKLAEKENE